MLKDRIQARLDALGISQFEAVDGTGLDRLFLYDILTGRKKAVRQKNLRIVAIALRCSVDYLLEKSDDVGAPPDDDQVKTILPVLKAAGTIDPNVWRNVNSEATKAIASVRCRSTRRAGRWSTRLKAINLSTSKMAHGSWPWLQMIT